jgi:hypothetical protein
MSLPRKKEELKILTPVGMLGYGFDEFLFWDAVKDGVDAIIVDCGSTDSGPSKLALDATTISRESWERDLDILLASCHKYKVPVILGSAGGDGANVHVQLFVDIIHGLITAKGYRTMNIVTIEAEIEKGFIYEKHEAGQVLPCSPAVPEITTHDINTASKVVAQMGMEPFIHAMEKYSDFDIIVAGRAYDPSPYAAFCIYNGFTDMGIAYHMGKIMECGGLCAKPKSRESLAIIREDSFDILPLNPGARCTPTSIAAHTLYEKTRPDILLGPGGALLLEGAKYEQLPDNRTVRVRGSKFVPSKEGEYTVKLEGARAAGYRSVFIGGFRDPILIGQLSSFLSKVEENVRSKIPFEYELRLHEYGNKGIMGPLEPERDYTPKEICLCGEARAATQTEATHVINTARIACLHAPYTGQLATAGNFAMPFPPYDIPLGQVSEFCIYHIVTGVDSLALFPIQQKVIPGSNKYTGVADVKDIVPPTTKPSAQNGGSPPLSPMTFQPPAPQGHCYLGEVASVLRTKNAGPYELTLDVMFDNEEMFHKVKQTGLLSKDTIARLYNIPTEDILVCMFWDPALAFKSTIKRPLVSGQFGETDLHGSQQHAPAMYLMLPFSRQ